MSSKNFCFEMMKNVTELVIFYDEKLQIKDKTMVNKINQEQNTDRKTRFCNGGIK